MKSLVPCFLTYITKYIKKPQTWQHDTVIYVSFTSKGYKWIPVNLMLWGNLEWTCIPSGGGEGVVEKYS